MDVLIYLRHRIQSCLRAKDFTAASFRAIVTGSLMAVTLCDVASYYQLQSAVKHGQLPWYTTDVLIMTIGLLEALSAPFWSWFGRWRLRTLTFFTLLVSTTCLGLLVLPRIPLETGSEFCTDSPTIAPSYSGMTTTGALRLTIIIVIATINVIFKAALWNHSIVLLDQTEPGALSLHYGILVAARVLLLYLVPKIVNEEMALWTQALGALAPLLIHSFQFYRLPEPVPQGKDSRYTAEIDTNIFASFGRVLSSGLAVGQIFAMALLTAPLWGYGWHVSDIIKMLFYVEESKSFVTNQSEILYYHVTILAVVTYGMFYSRPAIFDKASAMKLATVVSLIVAPLYCVQTMLLTCETGLVAGLNQNYTQPTCSSQCQCASPYSEFSPVCVVDTLTTYMSPCHAGCVGQDTIGGLTVYRGCACAPGFGAQRATVGACSVVQCRSAFILHKVITSCIVLFTVLALQAQMVTILRSVTPRDRPAAVGISTAVVLFFTFGCAHLAYFGIRAWTCAWSEGGRCQFYTPAFLQAIGGMSTGLAAASAIISLITWLIIRRRTAQGNEEIALARRDSNEIESRA